MPGTAYFFPKPDRPAGQPHTLYTFLSTDPSPLDLARGLEEFAWRSLTDGKRVRTYCAEVGQAVEQLPVKIAIGVHSALSTPLLSALLPLVDITPHAITPEAETSVPPALLTASTLLNVSRKQLIEVLSSFSREPAVIDCDVHGIRGQVLEVCLEYIGRRWRGGLDGSEDVVEGIARKLTEIEFELQGHPVTVRSIFVPIIGSLRFHLGFVSASQLVTRLNSIHNPTVRSHVAFDSHQLITAWLVTRLRAGLKPHLLVDQIASIRDNLRTDVDKEAVSDVLGSFGLLGRRTADRATSILGQSGLMSPYTVRIDQAAYDPDGTSPRKFRSSPAPKSSPRKANISSGPGRRWYHRRNNSSSSKLHTLAPLLSTDRRPSLPAISSPIIAATPSAVVSGISPFTPFRADHTSTSSMSSEASFSHPRLVVSETPNMTALLGSLMTFDNPEDTRFILLDYLMTMRYRLTGRQEDDWCLGRGQQVANETLTGIETRLVGRKDVMGLRTIFTDLRAVFDMPRPHNLSSSAYKAKYRLGLKGALSLPPPDTEDHIGDSASYATQAPTEAHDVQSQESGQVDDRGASFDLDQYIMDITLLHDDGDDGSEDARPTNLHEQKTRIMAMAKRHSSSAESTLTTATTISPSLDGCARPLHCTSMLSIFSIKQATRQYHQETLATHLQLPRRVSSLSELDVASVYDQPLTDQIVDHKPDTHGISGTIPFGRSNRGSRSESDLLEKLASPIGTDLDETYDGDTSEACPTPRNSLRRVSHMCGRLHHHTSAHELGLAHALPRTSALPSLRPLNSDEVKNYYATPIAIPQVPPIPRLPSIPSIPSFSSTTSLQISVNKNLAGMDTPPASPPLVDSSTISYSLSAAPYKTSIDTGTPLGKSQQRQIHRQWAIVDGAHVSPPRDYPRSVYGDDESDYGSSGGGIYGLQESVEHIKFVRAAGEDRPERPAGISDEVFARSPGGALGLSDIIRMFETVKGGVVQRGDVSEEAVRRVIKSIVNAQEVDDETRKWLLSELAKMLDEGFAPMINYYLNTLEPLPPLPPLMTRHTSLKRRPTRPSTLRHHSDPSGGSSDYPLTPPPASPALLLPESTSTSDQSEVRQDVSLMSGICPALVHVRGESFASMASVNTFGAQGLA